MVASIVAFKVRGFLLKVNLQSYNANIVFDGLTIFLTEIEICMHSTQCNLSNYSAPIAYIIFKFSNGNNRATCEICLTLAIKTSHRPQ